MKQWREGELEFLGEKISGRRYSYEAVATGEKETVGEKYQVVGARMEQWR